MLYAFNAASSSQTAVWSLDLAGQGVGTGYTFVHCAQNSGWKPCGGLLGTDVGVVGTPVIDTSGDSNNNTLYVAEVVADSSSGLVAGYYLIAVNIITGQPLAHILIAGSVSGATPTTACTTSSGGSTVTFDINHVQRSALLLLSGAVYVAFAPLPEATENGWMFGYSFNGSSFSQTTAFNTTPDGTGGGFWGAGAGPASDGTFIFAATGNGTFDLENTQPVDVDAADSLFKLSISAPYLTIADYYTPADVFTWVPPPPATTLGLCPGNNDEDFGSGGVLVVPSTFTYNGNNVVVNADKQSNIYVAKQSSLGHYNASGGNNIETVLTPCSGIPCAVLNQNQGYWASPAYWYDGTNSWLYYSPIAHNTPLVAPYPVYAFKMATSGSSGPIPQTATASTIMTLFCQYSPTPSVSSNPNALTTTGIVWAVENGNTFNPSQGDCNGTANPAALHAFNATTLGQLYSSRAVATTVGKATPFSTPTIFQGRVYMGTSTHNATGGSAPGVAIFGLCNSPSVCLP